VGAKKLSQLQDDLASADVELGADDLKALNEASAIKLGFPHDFYSMEMVRSFVSGGLADRIRS